MEFLGKGSFGSVYKLDEHTAMKCPKVYGYNSLRKEYNILKKVHELLPNQHQIVQAHNYNNETQCYNMEYLKNYQRLDKIKWKENSKELKKQIMKQIRSIIQELHNIGYAHHDIAMRNIMYNEETKQVKIIDFGLAHKLSTNYYKHDCIKEDLEMMEKVEKKLFYSN